MDAVSLRTSPIHRGAGIDLRRMIPRHLNELRLMRASCAPSLDVHDISHMTADTYFARHISKNCTHWIEKPAQGVHHEPPRSVVHCHQRFAALRLCGDVHRLDGDVTAMDRRLKTGC